MSTASPARRHARRIRRLASLTLVAAATVLAAACERDVTAPSADFGVENDRGADSIMVIDSVAPYRGRPGATARDTSDARSLRPRRVAPPQVPRPRNTRV